MNTSRSAAGLLASVLLSSAGVAVVAAPAQAQSTIRVRHGVLTVTGTNRSDTIHITGRGLDVVVKVNGKRVVLRDLRLSRIRVHGRNGDDTIVLSEKHGVLPGEDLYGDSGNDVLQATDVPNFLVFRSMPSPAARDGRTVLLDGGDGDDRLFDAYGIDRMVGGLGNDQLFSYGPQLVFDAGPGNDQVVGASRTSGDLGDGDDFFHGALSSDLRVPIPGGSGAYSEVTGGAGDDTLSTGDGNMTFDAGAGDDEVRGGWGATSGTLGDGNDTYVGELGPSTVEGGAGSDSLQAEGEVALFEGDGGADVFIADRFYDGDAESALGNETISDFGTDADVVHLGDGLSVRSGSGTPRVTVWDGTADVGTVTAANGHLWTAPDFG